MKQIDQYIFIELFFRKKLFKCSDIAVCQIVLSFYLSGTGTSGTITGPGKF